MRYDIYSVAGEILHMGVEPSIAAGVLNVDEHEIAWAIEDFGRCETEEHIVVQHGASYDAVRRIKPDEQDYKWADREYGCSKFNASDEERAERYRLAQADKLIRLYEQEKLPPKLMQEMDKVRR